MHWKGAQEYLGKTMRLVVMLVLGVVVVQYVGVSIGHVGGVSMEPTLVDGERFLVNRAVFFLHAPERGDVVQLLEPDAESTFIVKRIVGLPGETVRISAGQVFVTSSEGEQLLQEDYLPADVDTNVAGDEEIFVVGEYEYFVLGDNRGSSKDSRHFGTIHRKFVNGRIITL